MLHSEPKERQKMPEKRGKNLSVDMTNDHGTHENNLNLSPRNYLIRLPGFHFSFVLQCMWTML